MLVSPLLGLWLPMPGIGAEDPKVRLALTGRSGPLVVEIEYQVAQENARSFKGVMQEVELFRQRNGAYGWSIARDIADPELWTERYYCPTCSIICASATARPSRSASSIGRPALSTSVLGPFASDGCWSARSDRCAGRKTRPNKVRATPCQFDLAPICGTARVARAFSVDFTPLERYGHMSGLCARHTAAGLDEIRETRS